VLIGLMGAGKTTVGRRLASRLKLPFVDADHEIEQAAGKTIPEIFEEHGEQYFRDGERRVIDRLLHEDIKVIATGGGAYMNADTRKRSRRCGISVWLKADFDLLMKRVRKRSNRPLLQTGDPEAVMRKLIAEQVSLSTSRLTSPCKAATFRMTRSWPLAWRRWQTGSKSIQPEQMHDHPTGP
jgi:shikimate kinase